MGLNIPHRTLVMLLLRSAVTALRLSHMPCVMARAPRAVFCCLLLSSAVSCSAGGADALRPQAAHLLKGFAKDINGMPSAPSPKMEAARMQAMADDAMI